MIFISYSHLDKLWLDRFCELFKPLSRYSGIDIWSDQRIKPGEDWRSEINRAMDNALAAVLLVSVNFLASEFIATVELPYILAAAHKRKLTIMWVMLTPCLYGVTPLHKLQAAAGKPKPLNAMTDYEWMTAFCKVCNELDVIVKSRETPSINVKLSGRIVKQQERKLQVLDKPAFRETEVLVYSGDGWHTQSRIAKGSMTADCWIGDTKHTKPGDTFTLVALTRDRAPLSRGSIHPNLPLHRTKSATLKVKRV